MTFKVKPSIGAKVMTIVWVLMIIGVIVWFVFLGIFNAPIFIWLPILIMCVLLIIKQIFLYLRSFEFDEEGCKISLLFYSKKYPWSYYEVKEIEDCTKPFRRAFPYEKCIVFSKKKRKLVTWFDPGGYCCWFGDFSFIFLYYRPILLFNKYKDVSINEIDENEFFAFLSDIGVELVELP